ncbi:DUF6232 family protein [Methylophilus luteus]|uniref:DUF6232 family protein n=1 Tax=Methylophilus luteus TaxID=640108 RepID=A0ABW3F315_9PROT
MQIVEEQNYFNNGKLIVSSDELTVGNKTYPLSEVTSVRAGEVKHKKGLEFSVYIILLGLVIIVTLYEEHRGVYLGSLLITSGAILTYRIMKQTQYAVILTMKSGEHEVLVETDKPYIEKVSHAVSEVISKRD